MGNIKGVLSPLALDVSLLNSFLEQRSHSRESTLNERVRQKAYTQHHSLSANEDFRSPGNPVFPAWPW